jgi:hypothetical protein
MTQSGHWLLTRRFHKNWKFQNSRLVSIATSNHERTAIVDQFEYVMVLVSIIIGLGIAHILLGVAGLIDRVAGHGEVLKLSIAHAFWLAFCFEWMVVFWWWEYRFSTRVADWTIGLYLFLVGYAVTLFLMGAILVPRSWNGVTQLREYFLARRAWFYCLVISIVVFDLTDSYLKGGTEYILDTGLFNLAFSASIVPVAIAGIRTKNIRYHNIVSILYFGWQSLIYFDMYSMLAI